MKRKEFLTSAGLLGAMPFVSGLSNNPMAPKDANEFIEVIRYKLHPGSRQSMVADFYKEIAIPAYNRIGITKVGVFSPVYGPDSLSLFVMVPHKTLEAVYLDNEKLLQDKVYVTEGEKFLNPPMDETSFVRMEKSIYRAFDQIPTLEEPEDLMSIKDRIYELRTYESPSMVAAKKKVHMFNEGGEIAIFRKTGLRPVFFGECVSGDGMPKLAYMLAFKSLQDRDSNWSNFTKDPDWARISKDPYYKDTVSSISDIILRPAAFSQI